MSTFSEAFPNSTKVYVDGPLGVRVPMREIELAGGEPALRVYDTSGPQDHVVDDGLPKLRAPWTGCRRHDPCGKSCSRARRGCSWATAICARPCTCTLIDSRQLIYIERFSRSIRRCSKPRSRPL